MRYRDALVQAIEYWKSDPIEDEWFFERFRLDFIGPMTASEAFSAIDETIKFLLAEDDESTACEILQTIINLARKSETTEVPSALSRDRKAIEDRFLRRGGYLHSKVQELFRYYRLI